MICRTYVLFPYIIPAKWDWWNLFTTKGFTHCSVLEEMDYAPGSLLDGKWTILTDYRGGAICTVYYPISVKRFMELYRDTEGGLIAVQFDCRVAIEAQMQYIPLRLLTCVEFVKAKLGISEMFIYTPKQLYRYLLRDGGTEV